MGTASWCQRIESWGQSCGRSFSCCFNCSLPFPLPRRYDNGRGDHHPQSSRKRPNTFKSAPLSSLCVICCFQQWVCMRSLLCLTSWLIFILLSMSFKETLYVLQPRGKPVMFKWKWELSLNVKMVNCKVLSNNTVLCQLVVRVLVLALCRNCSTVSVSGESPCVGTVQKL